MNMPHLADCWCSNWVSPLILPGLSGNLTQNLTMRPSAASPRSRQRPRTVVSMFPPHNITTTLQQEHTVTCQQHIATTQHHIATTQRNNTAPTHCNNITLQCCSDAVLQLDVTQNIVQHHNSGVVARVLLLSHEVVEFSRDAGSKTTGTGSFHHTLLHLH